MVGTRRAGWCRGALAVGLIALAACGSGGGGDGTGAEATVLRFARGDRPDGAQRTAAAAAVNARLARLGLRSRARPGARGLTVTPTLGAGTAEQIVAPGTTQVVAVDATHPGPCPEGGPGTPGARPAARCFDLGAAITGTGAVRAATVRARAVDGWGVDVEIDPARWTAWRDALAPFAGRSVAVVADGRVVADVTLSVAALKTRIAGQLRKADAERIAAALVADADLPVPLTAPVTSAPAGVTHEDVWMAALAVRVCGKWLPPAPYFTSEEGLHSHADGLIYLHSLPADEVGRVPTLGRFADQGGWTVSADRLRLWDDVDVRAGGKCDGRAGMVVRWSVDGVERTGDPGALALAPAQHVVIDYGPPGDPLPAAPGNEELLHTFWGPQAAG